MPGYAFEGTVEFNFSVAVAGHRVEKKGRIAFKVTPDGPYFDPNTKCEANGSFEMETELEIYDPDLGWENASLSLFREDRDDMQMGAAEEFLENLITADAMRQSHEARLASETR